MNYTASRLIIYSKLCCGYMWNKIISALVNLPTEIILPEIISKEFQRLIAANEYYSTCSMSLK